MAASAILLLKAVVTAMAAYENGMCRAVSAMKAVLVLY